MSRVGYVYDVDMTRHKNPFGYHPERPERIVRIYQELEKRGFISKMVRIDSKRASTEELLLAHTDAYLKLIKKDLDELNVSRWSDIYCNEFTYDCALLAAGSTINLVDSVLSGVIDRGVAIVRPPGHHSTLDAAMGFCFFNNIAIAASKARNYGKRVAIIDIDIHFGNASAEMLEGEDNMYFFSIHRHDEKSFYPGTGEESTYDNIYNYPLNYSKGDDQTYIDIFEKQIIPTLKHLNVDLILVSAGYDAGKNDPIGNYNVTPDGFKRMVQLMLSVQQKLVLVLEGGYNLDIISKSMAECVDALFL